MSRNVFQGMRVVGIEDGSFRKGITNRALLAAVLLKKLEIEGVKFAEITVDGLDATNKAVEILREWNFDAVMLAGVSFAGFNVINPTVLHEKFQKPVVVVSRTKPDNRAVKRALIQHFTDWKIRWDVFEKLGAIHRVHVTAGEPPLYVETVGKDIKWAAFLIKSLVTCSRVPEPIRVAKLIARGLS
ncbi:MAG: DUF99 family protein [Candidatus Bathyarchaeales archaeon]